jgi:multiple sugar transport system permease protein
VGVEAGGGMKLDSGALMVNGSLAILSALTLFPLAWMLSASLMATGEASTFPPPLLPAAPTLEHYRALFGNQGLGRQALNSLFISTAATLLSLAFNLTAGYAFAKLKFKGREMIFRTLLAALVIPGQVAMMPLFLMLKQMGLVNTFAGALVPWLAGVFGIFLVRQYAQGIPDDLLEAARLDGAHEGQIFLRIVLPLLKPIVVTLAVLVFLGSWNDFMWPLIVLTDRELQTLPVALAGLSREHVQDTELMMAGSVLTVLPVLLLFLVLQRHYMKGLLMGSVK